MGSPESGYNPNILPSRQRLEEYLTQVSIFSDQHPEAITHSDDYQTPVPEGYPRGWDLSHEGKPLSHLTMKDATGNEIVYCLRPEGFDGFVYKPRTSYDRYLPVTHVNDKLLFGVLKNPANHDFFLPQTPIDPKVLRYYEDPFVDLVRSELPVLDHRDVNVNSAWVVTKSSGGLKFSGQAILPRDLKLNSDTIGFKNPALGIEANISFLLPEEIIPNRCGPTVAAAVLALENRFGISDISQPLPFSPLVFAESNSEEVLDTASFTTSMGGWEAIEMNGEQIKPVQLPLFSTNKRMGVTVQSGANKEGKDILRVKENGGGGSVVIPYFIDHGVLYVGVLKELRPNVSDTPYYSVVRGFVNPGETHRESISHEITQEMQYDGNPNDIGEHLLSLGLASQDPDMFGQGGVHYYALPIDKDILTESEGRFLIKPELRADTSGHDASEKFWEKIVGAEFIPAQTALESPCLFAIIATGRLLTSSLIPRPSR